MLYIDNQFFIVGSVEEGPRFDQRGMFLSHSVLGPVEDYSQELKMRKIVYSLLSHVQVPACTCIRTG